MKTITNLSKHSMSTLFMRYRKNARAFISLKDITVYS
jgi:hypothetical protein